MVYLSNFIFIVLICKIITQDTSIINKEHIENLKKVSEFEVFDYEEHPKTDL
jgi:hypothetical protein